MNEDYLHHIWKYQLFEHEHLKTTEGEKLEIIRPGFHNSDAGPDFFDGRIRIGNTRWAGNVEIHINSSDWNKHRHSSDPAYANVVLHVVFNHDTEIHDIRNRMLPTLELQERINHVQYEKYVDFISRGKNIPCSKMIRGIDQIAVRQQIDRAIVARLERKLNIVEKVFDRSGRDWEQTIYVMLARNFGFRVNALPFESLSWSTPLSLLRRSASNTLRMEALLFGQAGLLPESSDEIYVSSLIREYSLLQTMFGFIPMDQGQWKFSRMRPVNFPSIRIAQFASLIQEIPSLFRFFCETSDPNEIVSKLAVKASPFWNTHYTFSRRSSDKEKYLGELSVYNLLINSIVPVLFAYGRERKEQEWCDKALYLLGKIPPETNGIVRSWSMLGIDPLSAAETQGLIELRNEWCARKKCLNCIIGNQLLRERL
jgi:hypothetical protein